MHCCMSAFFDQSSVSSGRTKSSVVQDFWKYFPLPPLFVAQARPRAILLDSPFLSLSPTQAEALPPPSISFTKAMWPDALTSALVVPRPSMVGSFIYDWDVFLFLIFLSAAIKEQSNAGGHSFASPFFSSRGDESSDSRWRLSCQLKEIGALFFSPSYPMIPVTRA